MLAGTALRVELVSAATLVLVGPVPGDHRAGDLPAGRAVGLPQRRRAPRPARSSTTWPTRCPPTHPPRAGTPIRTPGAAGPKLPTVPLYALGDAEPDIHPEAYVHPDAVVIGNVTDRVRRRRSGPPPCFAGTTVASRSVPARACRTGRSCTARRTQPTVIGDGRHRRAQRAHRGRDDRRRRADLVGLGGAQRRHGRGGCRGRGGCGRLTERRDPAAGDGTGGPGAGAGGPSRCPTGSWDHAVQSYIERGKRFRAELQVARLMARPLSEVVEAGWARALEPVAPVVAQMGDFLRAELAAGRQVPPGRGERPARLQPAVRRRAGARGGAGSLPHAGARDRALVLGGAADPPDPAEPGQHLPRVQRRPRPPHAVHGGPHAVGRAGRAAAQQGAHRRAGRARLAPVQGLGDRHGAGDPRARGPRRAAARGDPLGARRAQPGAAADGRAVRRVGAPEPDVGRSRGSSGPGRSAASTRCSTSSAASRWTGSCRRQRSCRAGAALRRGRPCRPSGRTCTR